MTVSSRSIPIFSDAIADSDGWLALLHPPNGASFVSLRAKSVDTQGNMVEETIVRAYGLKP